MIETHVAPLSGFIAAPDYKSFFSPAKPVTVTATSVHSFFGPISVPLAAKSRSSGSILSAAVASFPGMAPSASSESKANGGAVSEQSPAIAASPLPPPFRHVVTADGSSGFPAEANRYHLYVSLACPWASRCFMVLKLKGLDDVISVSSVKPTWVRTRAGEDHFGWAFAASRDEEEGAEPDPIDGARFVRDLYERVDPTAKTFSVPILWDKQTHTLVNNESADILRMLNSEFNAFAAHPLVDLYPPALRPAVDSVNAWVAPAINSGIFKCGFAKEQKAYDEAVKGVFDALDRCEEVLGVQRFMAGDVVTEADIRLFVDLIRFDEVYYGHFNCNKKLIQEYPNLFNYTKEIFQLPGIATTVNMDHIRKKFFCSPNALNPFAICPIGRNIDYSQPHDRDRLPQSPLPIAKSGL